jgi:outer membrane protein TolC
MDLQHMTLQRFHVTQKWKSGLPCLVLSACLTISLFYSPPGKAATGDIPQIITLEVAWELAAQHNKELQMAQEEVIRADGKVKEAWSAALPSLSASGQYTRNIESPVFYITMGGVTQTLKVGAANAYDAVLAVQQPLWLAGKIGLGLRAAKLYRNLSTEALRSTGITLKYQVAENFYGVLLSRAMYEVIKDTYEQTLKHTALVHNLYEQGQVSEYDMIRADVQAANLRPQVLEMENGVQLAEKALKSLLGIDLDAQAEFQGELVPRIWGVPTIDMAYQKALHYRPEQEIFNVQKALNGIQYTVETRGIYWPNFFLTASVMWQTQSEDYAVADYEWNRSTAANLQVSIPLFDGFASKARKQQIKAQEREIHHQESQFHDGLRLQIQAALDDFASAQERMKAQEQTVQQAQRGLEIAEVRYQNGISTQLEVMDAQLALRTARTEYLKAVYDQRIAAFSLERALGEQGISPKEIEESKP